MSNTVSPSAAMGSHKLAAALSLSWRTTDGIAWARPSSAIMLRRLYSELPV